MNFHEHQNVTDGPCVLIFHFLSQSVIKVPRGQTFLNNYLEGQGKDKERERRKEKTKRKRERKNKGVYYVV